MFMGGFSGHGVIHIELDYNVSQMVRDSDMLAIGT